jgi:hypothetical protein
MSQQTESLSPEALCAAIINVMAKEPTPLIQRLKKWRTANDLSQSQAVAAFKAGGLPVTLDTLQTGRVAAILRAVSQPLPSQSFWHDIQKFQSRGPNENDRPHRHPIGGPGRNSRYLGFDASRRAGKGSISVGKDLEAVLRKIEHWHQAPVIEFRIMARQGQGAWHSVRWDGKTAASFPLNETDETKAMRTLLLQHFA